MDRESLKMLRYLKKENKPISRDVLKEKYGTSANDSISYLLKMGYIKQGTISSGVTRDPSTGLVKVKDWPNGMFEVDSPGKDYLQHKLGNDFDRWITRVTAIIGFITGVWSLILHFLSA